MLNEKELKEGFKNLGIQSGDILMIHSSYNSFGGVIGGAKTVINVLLKLLGETGTLIMPTYTPFFCQQFNKIGIGFYDVENSPSQMGILTEVVRKNPNSKRTLNPIYSVSVMGMMKEYFGSELTNNVLGTESTFAKLHQVDAKIMNIGLSHNNSWTFLHYIEEMQNVDYRSHKMFSGFVITEHGCHFDNFIYRVRNNKVKTDIIPMFNLLEDKNIIDKQRIGDSDVKVLSMEKTYDVIVKEMKRNPRLLYKIVIG